ncbi:glycerol-3-phosphate 1-O-acyltransferase PlsY [Limnoraphis robusta Tam1]|uniref:glycerol-3-phosphate 1-O-acyltransferase PlsY n=1 Tax=Limnoraphis robusta TaxID=1118279 RepID=UPI002B21ED7E|nr:glycerol-3-phosphate 1-O-acyltransferase PlsY [Limnoraphis robusta]MEA5540505.1 glycerol-3-phosphate 1-O-acyltransferase PlsY [Limnoraphis robusta Tam1]
MLEWTGLNFGLLVAGYLLGSIPTGYLVARTFYGIDLRSVGSGSTGATNVLRSCGKSPASFVLLVDVLKGVLAIALVFFVYALEITPQIAASANIQDVNLFLYWIATGAGLMALLGHTKPVWIGFQGGKAVATSLGILLALNWQLGLATLGIFGLFLAISRIVSLSSIAGAVGIASLMVITNQPLPYQIFAIVGGIYVIWRHRTNIERLLKGTEPRIGQTLSTEQQ